MDETHEVLIDTLKQQQQQLDDIYASVEKTRKYFLWTLIVSLVTFVLPLIILLVALPWVISTLTAGLAI